MRWGAYGLSEEIIGGQDWSLPQPITTTLMEGRMHPALTNHPVCGTPVELASRPKLTALLGAVLALRSSVFKLSPVGGGKTNTPACSQPEESCGVKIPCSLATHDTGCHRKTEGPD